MSADLRTGVHETVDSPPNAFSLISALDGQMTTQRLDVLAQVVDGALDRASLANLVADLVAISTGLLDRLVDAAGADRLALLGLVHDDLDAAGCWASSSPTVLPLAEPGLIALDSLAGPDPVVRPAATPPASSLDGTGVA